jgi:hypothetical protein
MDRIDLVEVKITGFGHAVGLHTVSFKVVVTDQDSMFVRGLREEWARAYDRLLADASRGGEQVDLSGLL